MVRGRDDYVEHQQRVADADNDQGRLLDARPPQLGCPKRRPPVRPAAGAHDPLQEARVVDERAADTERVGKVQARHGGELIDRLGADPDALRMSLPHRVEESGVGGQQSRRDTGEEREDGKGKKVGEGHGAAGDRKCAVIGGGRVVPGKEAGVVISGDRANNKRDSRHTASRQGCAQESTCGCKR